MKKDVIRAIKYLGFAGSAGLIEIVSFALLALSLSIVWNFTLNRRFTFKFANNITVAMIKAFLFYVVFVPVTTIGGTYLVENLGWNSYLVTGISMVLNFVLEFIYHRFYVFKDSLDTNNAAIKPKNKILIDKDS